MLPKLNQLKNERDFERIFKRGKTYKDNLLTLRMAPNDLRTSRFGFVVSRKVSKKATIRNLLKRRLRAIIRAELPRVRPGIDGVIIAAPGLEMQKFGELKKTLGNLFKKSRLIEQIC